MAFLRDTDELCLWESIPSSEGAGYFEESLGVIVHREKQEKQAGGKVQAGYVSGGYVRYLISHSAVIACLYFDRF